MNQLENCPQCGKKLSVKKQSIYTMPKGDRKEISIVGCESCDIWFYSSLMFSAEGEIKLTLRRIDTGKRKTRRRKRNEHI